MTIELRDVSYTYAGKYQRVTAVDTVSYTFQSGTMYSIMGASGRRPIRMHRNVLLK